jgi:hypothetical protein
LKRSRRHSWSRKVPDDPEKAAKLREEQEKAEQERQATLPTVDSNGDEAVKLSTQSRTKESDADA